MTTTTSLLTLTCPHCPATVTAEEIHVVGAHLGAMHLTMELDDCEVAEVAAADAARKAGWYRDFSDPEGRMVCADCADRLTRERTHPCPSWCTDCDGYTFFSEGTTHRRTWTDAEGEEIAEVAQHFDSRDATVPAWTGAGVYLICDSPMTVEEIRTVATLSTEVADFCEANDLHPGGDR